LGSLSDDGGTIHAGRGPLPAGVSCPPVTSFSSDSWFADDRGHGKGSRTRIVGAMEDKGGEQGWWRKRKKRERIRSGGARGWEVGELCGGWMRVAKVRILTTAPPMIYMIWGSNAPGNSACGGNLCDLCSVSLTNEPCCTETVTRTRERCYYGAATERARRPIRSAPHAAHNACGAPPEKARPLHIIRSHDRNALMAGFLPE
jgi:hypothetical protein